MTVRFMHGAIGNGLTSKMCERKPVKKMTRLSAPGCAGRTWNYLSVMDKSGISSTNGIKICNLSSHRTSLLSLLAVSSRKCVFPVVRNQVSDCDLGSYNAEEISNPEEEHVPNSVKEGTYELVETPISQSSSQNVRHELVALALPAIGGQALEPLAQLMETAYIGRLGPVELASAGVSISIFNIISKLFNIPLLSVATSFVAEDISKNASKEPASDGFFHEDNNNNGKPIEATEKKQLASVSTALLLAVGIGVFEALALYFGSGLFLNMMGISPASSMRIPAQRFLSLRALGAPAAVVSLALQGVFRGFKDTKTPLLCLGKFGNLAAVFLFPLLMYSFRLGVIGAAISTVLSQYIVTFLMVWFLNKRVVLLPPKMENLQFGGYVKSGGFLFGRTLAVLVTVTLGTSMAARQGPVGMAAHQICLQVWLAVSLLTDALAASAQALIASSFSVRDYRTVKKITFLFLQTGLFTGVSLAIILGASFGNLATLFTKDAEVLGIVRSGILFVCASQPINALAFICDGLHYGVSDFAYAAQSMMVVGVISSAFLLYAPSIYGLPAVWTGLVLFMGLRMVAGCMR
ncbi:Multi antimicrobial extrusion protein [Macleaya cordata]|uniref:Protein DETOXIFICATION n=1 Tax=Macleaya cordata TaxID=56857 RepID=A0A200QNC4_MACCD|nr:Multi antimicrobial extrusion protein [Macleaya cordata]